MRLQWLQVSHRARMALVMPGQNTVLSARAVMEVTPWCAECKTVKICCLRDGGMTMRFL